MKKRICTLISTMVCLLLISPLMLSAQQNSDSDQVVVEKKVTDQEGNVNIQIKNLDKGESLKAYLKALSLDNLEGKDVELNILSEDGGEEIVHMKKGGDGEETVFLFRSASDNMDLSEMRDELRSLRINLSKDHKKLERLHEHVNRLSHKHAQKQTCEKPLLGIYPETTENGVLVTGLTRGGGAEAAGIQKGDVITVLDGQTVRTVSELSQIIGQHKPEYQMKVDLLRNGTPMTVTSTLKARKTRSYSYNYNYNYNYDYNYDYPNKYRDPCVVFIGVYTTRTSKGMKISKVIEGTSAENAALQRGDIITALNGVQVRSHNELVHERDKNNPGDYYTLSIINNGVPTEIEAQFLECPKDQPEEEVIEEEETIDTPNIDNLDNNLRLINFNAYPNPTYGPVNIRFEGEAVPTTVRIVDASGKTVFRDVLNNFGGNYNRDVDVRKAAPGTLIVHIIQGDQMYTKPLVLLPRA